MQEEQEKRARPWTLAAFAVLAACRSTASMPGQDGGRITSDGGTGDVPSVPSDAAPTLHDAAPPESGLDAGLPDAAAPDAPAPDARTYDRSVLQFHNHASRDGVFVVPEFTHARAAHTARDLAFTATVAGWVYAQPLYFEDGPAHAPALYVATEENWVYALNPETGAVLWHRQLAPPVPVPPAPFCGNIDPLGITGTPVIDPGSRSIVLDAVTSTDASGPNRKHLIFALSVDDGSTRPGWPVDVHAKIPAFNAPYQNNRGALALIEGTVYVPYGGHGGDCGDYHGWVVAVPIADPASIHGFSTPAHECGMWAPGGIASDGRALYVATGNTFDAPVAWNGSEAVLRLGLDLSFSGDPADYFAPSNWGVLDMNDLDLGGTGPILVDAPGATPSKLIAAFGKNSVGYLIDRTDMGGVGHGDGVMGEGLDSMRVGSQLAPIINAPATYTTTIATYVAFSSWPGAFGQVKALRISRTAPPRISIAWESALYYTIGSPMVTTTDGQHDAIVWVFDGEQTGAAIPILRGYHGDTGKNVYLGDPATQTITLPYRYGSAMAAGGRIYTGAKGAVFAFKPGP